LCLIADCCAGIIKYAEKAGINRELLCRTLSKKSSDTTIELDADFAYS